MKVTFRTTFPDVAAFVWHHNSRSPLLIPLLLGMAGYVSWNSCRTVAKHYGLAVTLVTVFIVGAALFSALFLVGFAVSMLTTSSRRNKTFLTDNTLELRDDGFLTENRFGRSECRWGMVQKLHRTRRHILIYTARSQAIVVPRRAFASASDWDAFYEFLERHRADVAA